MQRTWGRPADPVAVVLPGAGSTADFVTRAFGPALAAAGYALVTAEPVAGPELPAAAFAGLDEAIGRYRVRLAGGVSLGAQLAVRWAAGSTAAAGLDGLLLALPAWTGRPGRVAAASAAAAVEVEGYGVDGALRRAAVAGPGRARWVLDELAAAWPRYGADLAVALRTAAGCAGPTRAELARVRVPVGLAAFVDDPLHPLAVADQWAAALRSAAVERLRLADPGADRALLGAAALQALRRAAAGGRVAALDPRPHRGRPVTPRDRRRG